MKTISSVWLLTVLLTTAQLTGCDAQGQEASQLAPPPPQVEVALVQSEEVTLWGSFTGRVAAPETVEIRPRVSGYVDRIEFAEGQLVQQGDVLFTIDQRPYQAREQLAAAEYERAQSELALAASEAARAEKLRQSRAISDEEFERRGAALAAARAAANAAAAALQSARLDLEYTEVRSPISGRIGRALLTRGNLASADASLLTTVVSMDPVHVYFESDQQTAEAHPHDLSAPVPVRVRPAGGEQDTLAGALDFIDNSYQRGTGTLQFRASVANADNRLRPGQFVRVEMPISGAAATVLIDEKAVLTDQDKRFVYVLDDTDTVAKRYVETGRRVDGLLVISQGLQTGDRVVVNGVQKIPMPGLQVAPTLVDMRRQAGAPMLAENSRAK